MATELTIELKNFDKLRDALLNFKSIAYPMFAKAINAALITVHKHADDSNFQFKTPRARRTGYLQHSFAFGYKQASPHSMFGAIGPTARYAIYVHEGTSRISPNPFMERIAKKAQPEVKEHFEETVEKILNAIAGRAKS